MLETGAEASTAGGDVSSRLPAATLSRNGPSAGQARRKREGCPDPRGQGHGDPGAESDDGRAVMLASKLSGFLPPQYEPYLMIWKFPGVGRKEFICFLSICFRNLFRLSLEN